METWVAYTVPRSLNIDPTLDDLEKLEKEELKKNKNASIEQVADTVSNIQIDIQGDQYIMYPLL